MTPPTQAASSGPARELRSRSTRAVPTQTNISELPVTPELIGILAVGVTVVGLLLTFRREARADNQALRAEFRADRQRLRAELGADIESFRTEVRDDRESFRAEGRADTESFRKKLLADRELFRAELRADTESFRAQFHADMDSLRTASSRRHPEPPSGSAC